MHKSAVAQLLARGLLAPTPPLAVYYHAYGTHFHATTKQAFVSRPPTNHQNLVLFAFLNDTKLQYYAMLQKLKWERERLCGWPCYKKSESEPSVISQSSVFMQIKRSIHLDRICGKLMRQPQTTTPQQLLHWPHNVPHSSVCACVCVSACDKFCAEQLALLFFSA